MHPTAPRRALRERLFLEPIPLLWCPLLVHYDRDGNLDQARIGAHLASLANWVGGLLVMGSTGDGWELTAAERQCYLEILLEQTAPLAMRTMVGVLLEDADGTRRTLAATVDWLAQQGGAGDLVERLVRRKICGFAVCPPTGRRLTQAQIGAGLESVFALGYPTALYQLPQVTGNEMGPDLLVQLAERHPHFVAYKDTSGGDRFALAPDRPADVVLLRGADGDYVRWLKQTGGPYDGLLIGSANCFPEEIHRILRDAQRGRLEEARRRTDRLLSTVETVMRLTCPLPVGNRFSNPNKAIDHYRAFGARAAEVKPPTVHGGARLPQDAIARTGEILRRAELLPAKGYLE